MLALSPTDMKTKFTLFVTVLTIALFLSGCASSITVMPVDPVVANIGILKQGELMGNNRDYRFGEVPKELEGLNFVRMECRGKNEFPASSLHYEYRVRGKFKVYALVVTDPVDGSELISDGWKKTEYTIKKPDLILVYEKIVSNGRFKMISGGHWAYMLAGEIPIKIEE